MSIRKIGVFGAIVAMLVVPISAGGNEGPERPVIDEVVHDVAAVARSAATQHRPPLEKDLSLEGFLDLTDHEFEVSDVWALGDFAYVGGFGPGTTVKVVDISDSSNPKLVNELAAAGPDCSPQDVKADRVSTKHFRGDLLVVGNEGCLTGLQLYDVSDPLNPTLLSVSGPGFVHNTYLYQRGGNAYVQLAVPFAEVFDGFGDYVVMDITDPANPNMIADWGIGADGGLAFGSPFFADIPDLPPGSDCTPPPGTPELCRGDDFPGVLLHDVWTSRDGKTAYLSYWDAGLILLDISDPANPTFLGLSLIHI